HEDSGDPGSPALQPFSGESTLLAWCCNSDHGDKQWRRRHHTDEPVRYRTAVGAGPASVNRRAYHASAPPSTTNTWPVTYRAASETRKRAAPLISSGPPRRLMGMAARISSSC